MAACDVQCPTCNAPAGTTCIDIGGYERAQYHSERFGMADIASLGAQLAGVALERDAAISLLLETPVECSELAPQPGRCGKCWTCRVDKFLRDVGARR